ncbi:28S ribosomal protein S10, mitochondrial [Eufriesea mexicana]|uniref:Small ribosomal subunit protein uS10m n=1 Tax=Eufriesea mexicana TaxID=516756 RepID=A0A310SJ15_9HYME|nr:28S ribosomal protein S10, mitochondrial [Eufriesea mexicana]
MSFCHQSELLLGIIVYENAVSLEPDTIGHRTSMNQPSRPLPYSPPSYLPRPSVICLADPKTEHLHLNIARRMENSDAVTIEGENYQVVDECIEEEDTVNSAQHKFTNLTDAVLSDNSNFSNDQNNTSNTENKCLEQSNMESIDFTADISLEQLDEQKDITDEDVLHHLDEIENIVLDSTDFQLQENTLVEENTENQFPNSKDEFVIKCEIPKDINTNTEILHTVDKDNKQQIKVEKSKMDDWYTQKLLGKETIIKERLSKVARVLAISYPCYEKWLEYEEKVNGSPLCNRKMVRDSITRMNNSDSSFNKNRGVVWKVEASGTWATNINNESQFPSFVLRAVKIFEDFLQTTEQLTSNNSMDENFSDDVSIDIELKKDINNEGKQNWLWLVVRCNSMDELMLFATGENISRSTMDRLKQVYESGPGKDCNVKSLYCKSTNKYNDTTVTDTTFLVGSEALDEIVGGLKVQLAPKTNFWSNTAGAENVANAVIDLLAPTRKITVLEIGCGIGFIGLMMASKCQHVIGVDSPSEVEEAEMTCELNNIKNASFIMGSPVTTKIIAAVKNRKTCAVINANTNIGRAIEVMTALRKIPSLKRIVMITTLTKQSVRAILELARPGDHNHGLAFIPILAYVVDTLPVGPHFEAVILMQRRMINKFNQPWVQKAMEESIQNSEIKIIQEKVDEQNTNEADRKPPGKGTELQTKMNCNESLVKNLVKKSKIAMKKAFYTKTVENSFAKNKFKGKRSHSPDRDLAAKKKRDWKTESSQLCPNPLYEKKIREPKEQTDLRERLSNNRVNTDIAQTVKEHQALLEIAKEKLSGPAPTVDVNTAKQLQNMLNMVLEQTNELQTQLSRSVWNRIASSGNIYSDQRENKQDDPLLKGRYVQEMDFQDILITMPNKKFLNDEESVTKPVYKKYNNLPPLEPNTIMPVATPINHKEEKPFRITPERLSRSFKSEINQNRDKSFEKNHWNEIESIKKEISPMKRQMSPSIHCITPPKRHSPKRPLLSPPRRSCSPPRRHFSPLHRAISPIYRQRSPLRCEISSLRRPMSPSRMSPLRQPVSATRRTMMAMYHPMSPLRQQLSPRQMSPMRSTVSPNRQSPPLKRPVSPLRRQIPSPNRIMSANRQVMLMSRRQAMPQERQQTSTMRRTESPHRLMCEHSTLPSRQQQSPQRRQMSSPRFADEWDIPSRGAIEQTTWTRPVDRMSEQNVWQNEKTPLSNNNWEQTTCNDRHRKTFNQEKWDNVKDSVRNDTWNNGGNTWNSKQMCTKPIMKETWSSNCTNRWSTTPMPGSSSDNWNIREKESFTSCKEPWMENKKQARWESLTIKDSWKLCEKEDLNDLPEDAKDPWGDDGTSDLKERWRKSENTSTSSTWARESEQGAEPWKKHNKDNWQNKGLSFGSKPQWQNNNIQNIEKSRWLPQNDVKKTTSTGWQNKSTHEVDKLYKKIEIEVRGNDRAVLKSYGEFAVMAANHLDITVNRNIELRKPIHERLTVLKSIHVHKNHRVQYETRTYYRYVDFLHLTGSTADTYLEYIQRNLPEGVAMKVTKVELQTLPDTVVQAMSPE